MGPIAAKKCPMILLLNFFVQAAVALTSELSRSMVVTFEPPSLHNLPMGDDADFNVTLSFPRETFDAENVEAFKFDVQSFHEDVANAVLTQPKKSDFKLAHDSRYYTAETVLKVQGNFLGKTLMKIRLVPTDDWLDVDENEGGVDDEPIDGRKALDADGNGNLLDLWVVRNATAVRWTHYFVVSVIVLISLANVMMGCELDLDAVWDTLKTPIAPAIGLFAQFIIMPLLSYMIACAIFVPRGLYSMALGIFITGCSPGGGASNFWTLLLDGNVNLSVTMTFISMLFSLVMMPTWLYFLGGPLLQGFSSDGHIKVPYGNISRQLVGFVVPLLVGIAIKKWLPKWAAQAKKVMRPFFIFVLVFVVAFGTATNLYMFQMLTVPALLGGLTLPWCGFMFGCFTALLTKRKPEDVTAIAIETGIQNTGIAILLLKASFSQPDADIGALMPVIVACFTPGPLLLGAAVHLTFKAIRKRQVKEKDCEMSAEKLPSAEKLLSSQSNEAIGRKTNGLCSEENAACDV